MSSPVDSPSVPWLLGAARAFLPQRWLACAAALGLSALVLWGLSVLFPGAPELAPHDWLDEPREQGERLAGWAEQARPASVLLAAFLAVGLLGATWATA